MIAAETVSRYLGAHGDGHVAQANAQLASYHAAYLTSAGVLIALAVLMTFLLRRVHVDEQLDTAVHAAV